MPRWLDAAWGNLVEATLLGVQVIFWAVWFLVCTLVCSSIVGFGIWGFLKVFHVF